MTEIAKIFVPWLGKSGNEKNKWHNRSAHECQKKGRSAAFYAVKRQPELMGTTITQAVNLTFTPSLAPSKRAFDCINYWPTVKAIEDGLVDAKLLINDSGKYVKSIKINTPISSPGNFSGCWVSVQI